MPGNVWILAVKRAERSQDERSQGKRSQDGTVIRIQERAGSATKASLKSAALGLDHTIELAPWELKTLSVTRSKGGRAEVREVSLLEA